jgi:Fic family protein
MTPQWIWQYPSWPVFGYSSERLAPVVLQVSRRAQSLLASLSGPDVDDLAALQLETLIQNLLKTSQIEGEQLDVASVRSSLMRRLQPAVVQPIHAQPTAQSDALARLVDECTRGPSPDGAPLDSERVLRWHRLLFAGSPSPHVQPGHWRQGPDAMQVVSQRGGRQVVHYEAPPASVVVAEMQHFLHRFQESGRHEHAVDVIDLDKNPWIRAAVVHFWFVTIHPFDDGNGRMARALSDYALSEYHPVLSRLLAVPASIEVRRRDYYQVLEQVQRGSPADISAFLGFWLDCVLHAFDRVDNSLARVIQRTRFWRRWQESDLLRPQIKLLHRMLSDRDDNFPHGVQAGQYARLCEIDKATATRHLSELARRGIVERSGAGRSIRYVLADLRDSGA